MQGSQVSDPAGLPVVESHWLRSTQVRVRVPAHMHALQFPQVQEGVHEQLSDLHVAYVSPQLHWPSPQWLHAEISDGLPEFVPHALASVHVRVFV